MPDFRAAKDEVHGGRTVGDVRRRENVARLRAFRSTVWRYWKKEGRHDLPWRHPTLKLRSGKQDFDPYRILVSEMMLQQTQVPRVIGKYKEFLKAFPTVKALAKAPLSDVLKVWSGLGYNRRAKYLHDAAKKIVEIGNIKKAFESPLPGVGPYTRAAVHAFAYNEPLTMIETNIRTAFIHYFFADTLTICDRIILVYAEKAAEGQDPRTWHWALMDYGAHLKRSGVRNNSRSAHYTKQSKFEGSLRQVRGAILRALAKDEKIIDLRSRYGELFGKAVAGLERDGLIVKEKGKWRIA